MTDPEDKPTQPAVSPKVQAWLDAKKKQRDSEKKVIDERYHDLSEYQESEEEHFVRINADPTAWDILS